MFKVFGGPWLLARHCYKLLRDAPSASLGGGGRPSLTLARNAARLIKHIYRIQNGSEWAVAALECTRGKLHSTRRL